MAKEVLNMRADARATSSWFIVETMGRKAGWLPRRRHCGRSNLVVATEDVQGALDSRD